jgi:hypothetical protein
MTGHDLVPHVCAGTAADLCVYALDLTSKEAISGSNGTADDRVPGMALCLVPGIPDRG